MHLPSCNAAVRMATGILFGWFLTLAIVWAQEVVLEIFDLRYRTASEVVPVVQPMLAPGGTVSGLRGQLVVRTTPGNLEEIRRVLASIDRAPRRLIMTVRQDAGGDRDEFSSDVTGRITGGSADAGAAGRDGRSGETRLQARVLDTRSAEDERNTQVVQVMEGAAAYVRVGQPGPVPGEYTALGGRVDGRTGDRARGWVAGGVEYREVGTGFYALPKVAGNQVTLEISAQREGLSSQDQRRIDVQRAMTTVSGRLGDWIEVAGLSRSASGEQSVILGRTSFRGAGVQRVLVKVEEAQ